MEIYYCDTCGKRASADDRSQSAAFNKILCKECLAKVPQGKTDAALKTIQPGSEAMVAPSARRTAKIEAGGRASTARVPPGAAGTGKEAAQSKAFMLWIAGGGGVLLLLIVLMVALSGRKEPPPKKDTSKASSSKPEGKPEPARPIPPPPSKPERYTPPVEEKKTGPRELTPKEIYEQKIRESKLKPPDPAPASGPKVDLLVLPTPPPDDPAWKQLLNGKDITPWDAAKGIWSVANGITKCEVSPERGGSLNGSEEFKDFELLITFKCSFHCEWHVRGNAVNHYLDCRDKPDEWRVLRFMAQGSNIQASLDGKPLETKTANNPSGHLSLFVHQSSKVFEIKEMRIRALAAPAVPAEPVAGTPIEIFNGKDLTGWSTLKGVAGVENGMLAVGSAQDASRIQTTASHGPYELTCKVMMTTGVRVEFQINDYRWVYGLNRVTSWKEVKVQVHNNACKFTVDGAEVQPEDGNPDLTAAAGPIGIYVPKGFKALLKDFKLTTLK